MENQLVYTPSDFVDVFNQSTEYAFPVVVVEGEISSFRVAKNRWVYFDIKDETATLRCFGTIYMLPGPLEDGMLVRIVCVPRLHPQFNFSLNIQSIQPVGEGAIAKQAELVYKKLEAEGIFLPERKRQPAYPPTRVALVSSLESAAFADFTKISKARWPGMQIDAYDVLVQGASAPEQIVARLVEINQGGEGYDAIVVIRGGGSAEDLSAFSDERVVRAIAASRIPTCVAIGHEVDESLAELACDMRASTPSNLAELMLPDVRSEKQWLESASVRLAGALGSSLATATSELAYAEQRLQQSVSQLLQQEKDELLYMQEKINLLSPITVLKRGYSMVKDSVGRVIKSGKTLHSGDEVAIMFADTTRKAQIL